MKCTKCGGEIGDKQKFCKYCGTPVEQIIVSVESTSQTGKCKGCGAMLKPGTVFCTQCGTPISADNVKGLKAKEKNDSKGSKAWKFIITFITIIALVLVAFVGFYFVVQYRVFEQAAKETETSGVSEDSGAVYEEGIQTVPVSDEAIESEGVPATADLDTIDVEAIVLQIRDMYERIANGISSNLFDITVVDEGVLGYSEQSEVKAIVVKKDYAGYGYARYYYYDGDELFFSYYEGSDSHRLYFSGKQLIRWRYCSDATDNSKATNYDLGNTSEYNQWEDNVLTESEKLLAAWKSAFINGTDAQEYILAGSDSRYIIKSELQGFTAEQCRLARNEIYARHGRRFDDEYLQDYFSSKDWYIPTVDTNEFEESLLNSYEIANRDLIVEYERECGYR